MPIMEFPDFEGFIKEMERLCPIGLEEKKGGNRFRLIFATGNQLIILQPTVTTQRVNTLLIRKPTAMDKKEIKSAAKKLKLEVTEVLNFWFDERKER